MSERDELLELIECEMATGKGLREMSSGDPNSYGSGFADGMMEALQKVQNWVMENMECDACLGECKGGTCPHSPLPTVEQGEPL